MLPAKAGKGNLHQSIMKSTRSHYENFDPERKPSW